MRQVLAIAAAAALAVMVFAEPAGAGSQKKGPTLKSLSAQIKSLQKQVTTLKKRVVNDEDVLIGGLAYSVCSTAVTADTFQDTFAALDAHAVVTPTPYFGTQTPVNDYTTCQAFSIVRAHNQAPPNTNVLRALVDIFKPASLAADQHGMDLAGQGRNLFRQFLVLARQIGVGVK
jgi:hypothetical protein